MHLEPPSPASHQLATLSAWSTSTPPERRARQQIDAALMKASWRVQSRDAINLHAGRGVAIREFPLEKGHGYADYLLYVDGQAAGVIEGKIEGETLTGVEVQAENAPQGCRMPCPPPTGHSPSSTRAPASRRASPIVSTPRPGADGSSISISQGPSGNGARA